MSANNLTGIQNLDIQCAEFGRKIAQIEEMDEKVLNAALAVLEEQGPYAMFLYVQARHSSKNKNPSQNFQNICKKFLDNIFPKPKNSQNVLAVIKGLAENLDDLLFAQQLLRNVLSYARLHLQALGGK